MAHAYEGFYARFDAPDKKTGALMNGADDLVGDRYAISFKVEDGRSVAWVANKFGAERGFFSAQDSRRIQLAQGRGQQVVALLSFVAYSDEPDPGVYWGEMAVFCFDPVDSAAMEAFIARVADKLMDGVRPDIDLSSKAVDNIFAGDDWVPKKTVPLPDRKKRGFAIIKDHRTASERAIEQGRKGNKGCYAVSWVFIIVVVAALVFGGLKVFGVL